MRQEFRIVEHVIVLWAAVEAGCAELPVGSVFGVVHLFRAIDSGSASRADAVFQTVIRQPLAVLKTREWTKSNGYATIA